MKKQIFLLAIGLLVINSLSAQWSPKSTEWYSPVPPVVKPGNAPGQPPSDAIVLFDGKDLSKWETQDGKVPEWKIQGNEVVITKGDIKTKEYFGDCQLHIEFKSPNPKTKYGDFEYRGQMAGNSGVFLQSIYELQILDADNTTTYVNGMVGSIYKQSAPLANAYTKNGEWQVFDIYWKAPKFGSGGKLEEPAIITVVMNGILIQNNFVLKGGTEYIGLPDYKAHGRLPLMLQDHGTPVAFRNIWIRNL
ncbi:MAG: DUF1080 domain-containing protein [Bacteroidales bacterium]|jgi:hypothetical protein|nr:DUF1080 domain-containing protein [Bacteroidales bacterium]